MHALAGSLRRAASACALAAALAPAQELQPLAKGPAWRLPIAARNEVFASSDGCAHCHSSHANALAMLSPTGADVSPHGTWQASVMANSARDPFWRAQVAREIAADPDRADELHAQCTRCHAPMHAHTRRLGGEAPLAVDEALRDPLARDGVSCTVCHQIRADGLGSDATFGGKGRIEKGRRIFGPFPEPVIEPMRDRARYDVVHGAHVQSSALCASCHTLVTEHAGEAFPEQTPYFEWRNSEFTDEPARTATSRSCQQCHMPESGPTRIARDPAGGDFLVPVREPYRTHTLVGGNAFLLEMLAANRDELAVPASAAALRNQARLSRRLLAEQSATLTIGPPVREKGELRFDVRVENLTGHKFPTGFPSRRAWLHVQVRNRNGVVFDSGGYDRGGRILGVDEPMAQPHATHVGDPGQVVIYELVAADETGEPTTLLTRMQKRAKDTRLLPRGWRRDGPHAAETAPVGIGNDFDFTAGGDTVSFAIPYSAFAEAATIVAWLRYQTMPPHWIDPLRALDDAACRAFVAMYDAADKTPELAAVATREEGR